MKVCVHMCFTFPVPEMPKNVKEKKKKSILIGLAAKSPSYSASNLKRETNLERMPA